MPPRVFPYEGVFREKGPGGAVGKPGLSNGSAHLRLRRDSRFAERVSDYEDDGNIAESSKIFYVGANSRHRGVKSNNT